jgi:hypothetical protein
MAATPKHLATDNPPDRSFNYSSFPVVVQHTRRNRSQQQTDANYDASHWGHPRFFA